MKMSYNEKNVNRCSQMQEFAERVVSLIKLRRATGSLLASASTVSLYIEEERLLMQMALLQIDWERDLGQRKPLQHEHGDSVVEPEAPSVQEGEPGL
jgi:hypothetical protein